MLPKSFVCIICQTFFTYLLGFWLLIHKDIQEPFMKALKTRNLLIVPMLQ